jgi:fucose permease
LCNQSIASLHAIFLPGEIAIYGLIVIGFTNSVLWGAIWPLAIADLGKFTKKGASAKTSIGYRKCDARRAGLREG